MNSLFIYEHFSNNPASVFSHVFILESNTHEQNTRFASHGLLTKPRCSTSKYNTNGFAASATASWNFFQNKFPSNNLRQISYSQLKVLIKNYVFSSYIVKTIQKIIDFYKMTKNVFLISSTRKYCKILNFFLKKYYINLFFISI